MTHPETLAPTPLSRAACMHDLAIRSALLEADQAIGVALQTLAEVEEMSATRKVLQHERNKLHDLLSELPVYRPPERGQGENVDSEHMERVRVARAGEDTRGVEV